MKRFVSMILAAMVIISALPVNALAATFSVGNDDELENTWRTANNNSDSSNTFNMTADIDMSGKNLLTTGGKSYTINGNGNDLSNVSFKGDQKETETVTINADVTSKENTALTVYGDVTTIVQGDVSNTSSSQQDVNNNVLHAAHGATVAVSGNVTSEEGGIYVNGSDVTVFGNVKLESEGGVDPLNPVIEVGHDGHVDVYGNVTSEEGGLHVSNGSSISVEKNVTTQGQTFVSDGSTANIDGSFVSEPGASTIGEYSGVFVTDSELTVKKDIEAPLVYLEDDAAVKVGGELEAQNTVLGVSSFNGDESTLTAGSLNSDVDAMSDSTVTVNKDAQGTISVSNQGQVIVKGDLNGSVSALNKGSSVIVNGDVTADEFVTLMGGGALEVGGDLDSTVPVVAITQGKLEVIGDVTAPSVEVAGDASAWLGATTVDTLQVGLKDSEDDNTKVSVYGDLICDTATAYGNAMLSVGGYVQGTAVAEDNAAISIYYTASEKVTRENGVINENTGNAKKTEQFFDNGIDPVLAMCIGYAPGSILDNQVKSLWSLAADLNSDFTNELGVLELIVTSALKHEEVNLDTINLPRMLVDTTATDYHPQSLENMENAKFVSGYHVDLYKENLHKILKTLDADLPDELVDDTGVKMVIDICKGFFGNIKDSTDLITPEQFAFLADATKDGGLSLYEAKNFLVKFKYVKESSDDLADASMRLMDMFHFCDDLTETSKTLSKTGTVVDAAGQALKVGGKAINVIDFMLDLGEFADFWFRNYEAPLKVLDNMLRDQPMSAEMFIAAATLRQEYADKGFGIKLRTFSLAKDKITDFVKGKFSLFSLVEGSLNLTGLLSGANSRTDHLMNGTALCGIINENLKALEYSIQRVQTGDTSEEAVETVKINYEIVLKTLETMCETMTHVGDKDKKEEYEDLLETVKGLDIGNKFLYGDWMKNQAT